MSDRPTRCSPMGLDEFRSGGYLAEANRRFFHPLGLALAINETDDQRQHLMVLDGRDDPEGWNFGDDLLPDVTAKATRIHLEEVARFAARHDGLGYWIQPLGE